MIPSQVFQTNYTIPFLCNGGKWKSLMVVAISPEEYRKIPSLEHKDDIDTHRKVTLISTEEHN